MTRTLSSLQQAVIDRLRNYGHVALAEEAHEAWRRGDRLTAYQIGRSVGDSLLARDFEQANMPAVHTEPDSGSRGNTTGA
jgi:hypothetical protein